MHNWNISYSYPIETDNNNEPMHKLHVFIIEKGGSIITNKHHGKLFETYKDAFDYAKKNGLLKRYTHYTRKE